MLQMMLNFKAMRPMFNLKAITGFVFLLVPLMVQAQDVLTLQDAVQQALEQNFSIKIEKNNAEIDANNVTRGNAGFLPSAGVDVTQSNSVQNTRQEFVTGTPTEKQGAKSKSFNAGAGINWTIFDGFQMFAEYDRLQLLQNEGLLELRLQVELVTAAVMANYFEIVALQENIVAIEEALEVSMVLRALTLDKKEIGVASGLEVMQSDVDLNAERAALLDQEELLQNAKVRLNRLLARNPATDFTVVDTIIIAPHLEYARLLERAEVENTELQLARLEQQILDEELDIVKAQQWPQLDLNAGYNYQTLESESGFLLNNRSTGLQYGFGIRYNIFNGFNVRRQKENLRIAQQSALLLQEQVQHEIATELLLAHNTYTKNLQKLQLEQENVVIARQTLDIIVERYRLGDLAGIEMREAQQQYLVAQSRLITALYLAKLAEIELQRISGGLVVGE